MVSLALEHQLDFLPEAAHLRSADWTVASAPVAPQDRHVGMTGPVSPAKMAIDALNSGARFWLADLEEAFTPTGHNVIDSQLSLSNAARGALANIPPEGKEYALRTEAPLAVVGARPDEWHLAKRHIEQSQGLHRCLPRVGSPLEARLRNGVFALARDEFRDHASACTLLDCADISMTARFMRAHTHLLVEACHHRNAFASGGMADVTPDRSEPGVTAVKPLDTACAPGRVTEAGPRSTLYVAFSYVAVWLSVSGAVAVHHLLEDDATAELRAQVGDDAFPAHCGPAGTLSADFLTIPDYELVIQ